MFVTLMHAYMCSYVVRKFVIKILVPTCEGEKERDMGGVGTMIGTSASKRGWSGRGHMRARVEGLVVGEWKLQTNGFSY